LVENNVHNISKRFTPEKPRNHTILPLATRRIIVLYVLLYTSVYHAWNALISISLVHWCRTSPFDHSMCRRGL